MRTILLQTALSYVQRGDKCLLHFTNLDTYNTFAIKSGSGTRQRNCLRDVDTFRFSDKELIGRDSLQYYLNSRSFKEYTLYKVVTIVSTISCKE